MRVSSPFLAFLGCVALSPTTLLADYSYQETSQITGGSLVAMMKVAGAFSSAARKANEPMISSVYLKGNRLARVAPDHMEIIDLDKETITQVDTQKHTYTVMTFAQMRAQMAKAEQEMKKKQGEKPQAPVSSQPSDVKMSFDVKVRNTGVEKQVSGVATKEAILTMTMNATDQKSQQTGSMAVTNDMWVAPEIAGYKELRSFYMRMAEKMDLVSSGFAMEMTKMLAQSPGANQALGDMAKEMQKIEGVPVMQVMRMGMTTDGKPLPAASEAPLPQDNSPAMPSAGDVAKESAVSTLTSKLNGLGGFGGFGRKKKEAPPAPEKTAAENGSAAQPTAAILMETQVTSSNFSTDSVDGSRFDVPAGYRMVELKGQ